LTLSGGVLTNTASPTPTGYYGAFQDNQNQNATLNDTGFAMIFRQTILSNGVSIVSNGTSLTRITFANTGIYNLQFSSQFENTDNEQHYVTIWLRKNGNDVPESSSIFTLPPRKNASTYGQLIPAWNFVFQAIGGDYFEIVWSTNDYTKVSMPTLPATAYAPIVPSVILTATQQAGIMAGTGITALNGLTPDVQTFATGETGTDFNIDSSGSTHTFNIPSASAANRGLLSSTDWSTFNSKIGVSKSVLVGNFGSGSVGAGATLYGGFVKATGLYSSAQSFQARSVIPIACVGKTYTVNQGAQPATGSCVHTIRIDGVDTAYTLTIVAGSATGVFQNTSSSINFNSGATIDVKIQNNASSSTGAIVAISMILEI